MKLPKQQTILYEITQTNYTVWNYPNKLWCMKLPKQTVLYEITQTNYAVWNYPNKLYCMKLPKQTVLSNFVIGSVFAWLISYAGKPSLQNTSGAWKPQG